jgi:type IV pilus assembly protein PilW
MKKITGMTLIELMLAITISMLILSMLTTIYLVTKKNDSAQIAVSNIQENARIAMHWLHGNIRTAGYLGCAKLTDDFPIINYPPYELTRENKISSSGSDTITIRGASISSATLVTSMRGYATLYVSGKPHFSEGDVLLISDCRSAEIFLVKKAAVISQGIQKITTKEPLHTQYQQYAEVSQFESNTYFVGKTNRQSADGSPIYALYIEDIYQQKTELVEGVEDMKIHYDINDNGIVGISIALTLSSLSNFSLQKKWYTYVTLREI